MNINYYAQLYKNFIGKLENISFRAFLACIILNIVDKLIGRFNYFIYFRNLLLNFKVVLKFYFEVLFSSFVKVGNKLFFSFARSEEFKASDLSELWEEFDLFAGSVLWEGFKPFP